jgi:hypothetical protein
VNEKKRKRVNLNVTRETKAMLDSLKHTGQSYDGLIRELLKFWKDKDKAKQTGIAGRG